MSGQRWAKASKSQTVLYACTRTRQNGRSFTSRAPVWLFVVFRTFGFIRIRSVECAARLTFSFFLCLSNFVPTLPTYIPCRMSVLCPILTIFNHSETMATVPMASSVYRSRVMSYDNNGNGRASQTPPPPVTSTTSAEVTSTVTCTSSSTVVDTPAPLSRRVRRRLFPEQPVDHAANREFLRSESAKIREQQRQKYNFDFEEGRPINEPSGSYQWEQVTPTVSSLRYSPEKASTSSEKSLPSTTPSFEITPIEIATPSPATSGSSVCTGSTSSIWTTKATTITSKTPQFSLTTTHRSSQPSLLGMSREMFRHLHCATNHPPPSCAVKYPLSTDYHLGTRLKHFVIVLVI